ncbi:unnamed protein product [Prunus armeniaca]|uniref:Uncharacterized protein n=1 Tax=Prunus armeniaca TaxID=36596 RepID=A0A6J5X736_PRUAR|nr:unnamed protein product [Prunus armeniaca]
MAKRFEGLVRTDERFEVVVPRNFALVCFRISPSAISRANPTPSDEKCVNEVNCKLLEVINGCGRVYTSHAVVGGMYVLLCAIGASLTEEKHVAMAWKVVQEHVDAILSLTMY